MVLHYTLSSLSVDAFILEQSKEWKHHPWIILCRSAKSSFQEHQLQITKLMRLNRSKSTNRLYSWSNRLLIDFFDPNLAVQSIVATILIQNLGPNSKLDSNLSPNLSIISKIGQIWSKIRQIWSKTTFLVQNQPIYD